jgi:fumarylpyruvate hydrolase
VTSFVIPAPTQSSVELADIASRFPVRRVFCVERNFAAHARELGKPPLRNPTGSGDEHQAWVVGHVRPSEATT